MDFSSEADKLMRQLRVGGDSSSSSSTTNSSQSTAPPPPPPPPPPSVSSSSVSVKVKSKDTQDPEDAKKYLEEVFDSVISFAEKSSAKKTPPPVAPKPKKKVHVSSYTMQIRSPTAPAAAAVPNKPPPPPTTSAAAAAPPRPPPPSEAPEPARATSKPPVVQTAFGPGLETFEVNSIGHFQVSAAPDVDEDDLEIKAVGPTGSKPVDVTFDGNGQFSCSYQPTAAGDHEITIKVKGAHIPGSPFKANVKFMAFTDKCTAEGPGLVSGTTDAPCRFTIHCKEDAGFARLRVHILGPSKAEPIDMIENVEGHSVDVAYHPSAPGDYTIRVLWGDAHVRGSPFTVPVTGSMINDVTKVLIHGDGLKGGKVGEDLKFFVEGEAGAGPGPLGVRMVGPSKPDITADDSKDEGVELTIRCRDPGEYQLILKWGNEEVPTSPYTIPVEGEGREVHAELCTASGKGISQGEVGTPATFVVTIPDEAGPGTLGVTVSGPHPPKPIEIINNQDGTMGVSYHPICPGEYKIEVLWGNQPIRGSPFSATVRGDAVRNAKYVTASGEVLEECRMKCKQLGTITVTPGEGAGPGPLRAKLEGPTKADLQLTNNGDGTMLVSFIPKDAGSYSLHLLWGDAEDPNSEISGSPFLINVD